MSVQPEDRCKDGPAIAGGRDELSKVLRARADDLTFVALVLPLLDTGAIDGASDVRLKPGDPARAMLDPAAPGALPIRGTCR